MSTIRETIETAYAASAFAERNLSAESTYLLKGEKNEARTKAESARKTEKRPRPVLHAK